MMSFGTEKPEAVAEDSGLGLKSLMDLTESALNSENEKEAKDSLERIAVTIKGSSYSRDQLQEMRGFAQSLLEKSSNPGFSPGKRSGCGTIISLLIDKMLEVNAQEERGS